MSCRMSWVGPAMSRPGTIAGPPRYLRAGSRLRPLLPPRAHGRHVRRSGWTVSLSVHATLYEAYGEELAELLDTLLAGEVI